MIKDKVQGVFIHHSFFEIEDLSLPQKLIYAKICDLDNEKGCYASNRYFAQMFKISPRQVSTHINNLVDKKYVTSKMIYKEGTSEIDYRVLNTTSRGMEDLQHKGYGRTIPISKDNINNNIKERGERFIELVNQNKKYEDIADDFIRHWIEPNRPNTKMKFEMEKTWSLILRLETWLKRDAKWNKKKTQDKKITQYKLDSAGFPMGFCKGCGEHSSYDKYEILTGESRCCSKEILPKKQEVKKYARL